MKSVPCPCWQWYISLILVVLPISETPEVNEVNHKRVDQLKPFRKGGKSCKPNIPSLLFLYSAIGPPCLSSSLRGKKHFSCNEHPQVKRRKTPARNKLSQCSLFAISSMKLWRTIDRAKEAKRLLFYLHQAFGDTYKISHTKYYAFLKCSSSIGKFILMGKKNHHLAGSGGSTKRILKLFFCGSWSQMLCFF